MRASKGCGYGERARTHTWERTASRPRWLAATRARARARMRAQSRAHTRALARVHARAHAHVLYKCGKASSVAPSPEAVASTSASGSAVSAW